MQSNDPFLHNLQENQRRIEARLQAILDQGSDSQENAPAERWQVEMARRIFALAEAALQDGVEDTAVSPIANELAVHGLPITAGRQLVQALHDPSQTNDAAPPPPLLDLQFRLLEQLALARETIQAEAYTQSEQALKEELQIQLEQQRRLHFSQEQHNESLHQILELDARLARIDTEVELLEEASLGICFALGLEHVILFERRAGGEWVLRTSTHPQIQQVGDVTPEIKEMLSHLLQSEDNIITIPRQGEEETKSLDLLLPLNAGDHILGAILANSGSLDQRLYTLEDLPILLQTFAQSLAAIWHDLSLLRETQIHAHELEIWQGRYIDSIWNTKSAALEAKYGPHGLNIVRANDTKQFPQADDTEKVRMPLHIGEQPFGFINLSADTSVDTEKKEIISVIVREMGNALNNAHLLQTTRTYSNQLSLATEVSRAASTVLDRDLLIQDVVDLIRDRFDLYYVGLFLVDEAGDTAVLQAGTGKAGKRQVESGHQHKVGGESMIGAALARSQAIVEQDVSQAEAFVPNPLLPQTKSELAIPMRTRGRIIGALTAQSVNVGAFSNETVQVLQSMADQLAIAIVNAELFAQTQDTLAEMSSLYEASRQINTAVSAQSVYQALIDFAAHTTDADVVQIITSDEENPQLLFSTAQWSRTPLTFHLERDGRYQRDPIFFRQTVTTDQISIFDNVEDTPFLTPGTIRRFQNSRIQNAAVIPINVDENWFSTLMLYRAHPDPLQAVELQSLRNLADQAAIILSNQRLLAEIRQANHQLRQLDQLKTQFLANMSHELRTPLNSIIGFSRVILKGIDGPITPEQKEDLTSIYNNGHHLLQLINEILDMAKIEAGKMMLTFEKVDLYEAAQAALSTARSLLHGKDVELLSNLEPNLPLIEADTVRLRQILNNLLSNAVKFTETGYIRLTVERESSTHIHIAVADTGVGINEEDFETLFRAFEQIDSSPTRAVGGTGLGLPITKWLINMHQGKIWPESEVGVGTTFHISLPIQHSEEIVPDITFDESQAELS